MLIFCKSFYCQEEFKKEEWISCTREDGLCCLKCPHPLAQSQVCVSMSCNKLTTTASLATKAKVTEDGPFCFWNLSLSRKQRLCARERRETGGEMRQTDHHQSRY